MYRTIPTVDQPTPSFVLSTKKGEVKQENILSSTSVPFASKFKKGDIHTLKDAGMSSSTELFEKISIADDLPKKHLFWQLDSF